MEKRKQHQTGWRSISHFAGHIAAGAIMLVSLALPAVILRVLVNLLPAVGVDGFTLELLSFLEHAVLVVDSALFLVYMLSTAYKSVKEMFK